MYPDDSLFQLGNRRGTGDDFADGEGDSQAEVISLEQIAVNPYANNTTEVDAVEANAPTDADAPAANITKELILAETPDGKNSTNEQSNKDQDLFKKPKVPSQPPQTDVQTPAILIEMLDFELTLTFTEPQRRLLRSYSNSRPHRQAQGQARNTIVKNTLTKYFDGFYLDKLSSSHYTPLDQVFFNDGESERVIVSKSSVTDKLYDLASTSAWSGLTLFRKTDELQRLPSEFTVQAIQLQALADESDLLFSALKEADAGGVGGLDGLESIKASIIFPSLSHSADTSTNIIIGGESLPVDFVDASVDETLARRPQSAEIDAAVFVALIVASLSFALLAITLFVAYRRSQASPLRPRNTSSTTKGESKMNDWKVRDARPDEIPPAYSSGFNTIASSASPTHGIQINTDGEDADDEMSLPAGAELQASVDKSDGASVSAFSDVSSLGNVIQDAIKVYQNNVGNHSTCSTPEPQDTFFHRFATGRDEDESVGVASIDDSSQLGALSLAG